MEQEMISVKLSADNKRKLAAQVKEITGIEPNLADASLPVLAYAAKKFGVKFEITNITAKKTTDIRPKTLD